MVVVVARWWGAAARCLVCCARAAWRAAWLAVVRACSCALRCCCLARSLSCWRGLAAGISRRAADKRSDHGTSHTVLLLCRRSYSTYHHDMIPLPK